MPSHPRSGSAKAHQTQVRPKRQAANVVVHPGRTPEPAKESELMQQFRIDPDFQNTMDKLVTGRVKEALAFERENYPGKMISAEALNEGAHSVRQLQMNQAHAAPYGELVPAGQVTRQWLNGGQLSPVPHQSQISAAPPPPSLMSAHERRDVLQAEAAQMMDRVNSARINLDKAHIEVLKMDAQHENLSGALETIRQCFNQYQYELANFLGFTKAFR